jgi:hypothetical protein
MMTLPNPSIIIAFGTFVMAEEDRCSKSTCSREVLERQISDVAEEEDTDIPKHGATQSTCSNSSISSRSCDNDHHKQPPLQQTVTVPGFPYSVSRYPVTRSLPSSPARLGFTTSRYEHYSSVSPVIQSTPCTPLRIEYSSRVQHVQSEDMSQTIKQQCQQQEHHPSSVDLASDLPYVSLQPGLARKQALCLRTWTQLVLTLDGRDKFTKVLQYISRFLAWWLAASHPNAAQRCAALKASLVTSRKAFRLGRSMVEVQKLRSLGLLESFYFYLTENCDSASSSIVTQWRALVEKLYVPLVRCISDYSKNHDGVLVKPTDPLWIQTGTALKMIGLLGFWAGDNVSFLAQSGVLDDFRKTKRDRLHERLQYVSTFSSFANQSYFAGSVAGLWTNWKAYWEHRNTKLREASESGDDQAYGKAQEKQFTLFLALLKSCCDVLVFSNNPGLDLWKKYRGQKMHEGFHCLCGLLSAMTILYNNCPDATNK